MNGGMQGNPFGNFNPISLGNVMKMEGKYSNFDQSFQKNEPLIEKIDYTNYNELLHNNVGATVLDETIIEYKINIDSLDRDIRYYPDPFSFKVKFNPPSPGTVRTEVLKNGQLKTINDYMPGPPRPHIGKEFRNVKYIKLDNIVLPQYSNIIFEETDNGPKAVIDRDSYLIDDRYVALVIDELNCQTVYCTSDDGLRVNPKTGDLVTPPVPFGIIFPDKLLGKVYYVGTPYYASKTYENSLLGNINTLTIQFFDSCGQKLKFDNLFTFEDLIKADEKGKPIPISNIRHPLNKNIQVYLSFIIGVVESQINNDTKFER